MDNKNFIIQKVYNTIREYIRSIYFLFITAAYPLSDVQHTSPPPISYLFYKYEYVMEDCKYFSVVNLSKKKDYMFFII